MAALESLKRAVKQRLVSRQFSRHQRRLERTAELRFGHLAESYWGCDTSSEGILSIGGVDARVLADRYGTPLQVVNFERLKADHDDFLSKFRNHHENTILGTSYKTNPVPAVLRDLHSHGTIAEVISDFELWLALELGVAAERIIFNGPGKPKQALERAVDNNIWLINADSIAEIELLDEICAQRGVTQKVGLRVTTSVGWQSQFGMNIAAGQATEAAEKIAASPVLDLIGLHLHLGNGITDTEVYVEGVAEVIECAADLENRFDVTMDVLDLGGGFGVPTVRKLDIWDLRGESLGFAPKRPIPEDGVDAESFAGAIFSRAAEPLQRLRKPVQLIFEPGRAITSQSQVLLLSVIRKKRLGSGNDALILDGGRNISMPLGWEYHEILPATRMRDPTLKTQSLFGPLCHPGDVVGLHRELPALDTGDVVAIMDSGAYFVPNQTNFSNPRPAIVGVRNGRDTLLRDPESYEDIVRLDR